MQPSIFDIISQESLNSSLRGGVKNFLKLLALWCPQKFAVIEPYFDEFYLLLNLLVEGHFLKQTGGTFSENFYGIKRVPVTDNAFSLQINWRLRSLIIQTVVPYIGRKFNELHKRFFSHGLTKNVWTFLFTKIYPVIRALFLGISLIFHFTYTFSLTDISSPLLYFAGVKYQCISPNFQTVTANTGRFTKIIKAIPSLIGHLFTYTLFLSQFFNYYYSNDMSRQFGIISLTNTRPFIPHPLEKVQHENEMLPMMEVGKCPICHCNRMNDAVLTVSGYLFCYPCIYSYLCLNGRCPVTQLPATTDQLIKVFYS